MGQPNAKRIQAVIRETVTTPASDDKQIVAKTCFFHVGDIVDVIDEDVNGNITSVLASNLSVLAIDVDAFLVLSASVDTTVAVGTPRIASQTLDDMQEAIERALCPDELAAAESDFTVRQSIITQALNSPIGGQTTYEIANAKFFRPGDTFDILADEGIVQTGAIIVSVSPNADSTNNRSEVVISTLIDTSTFTNPFLISTDISVQDAIERNQEDIDQIDKPLENEDMDLGNGTDTCFETDYLFRQGSSKILIDGVRKRLGTAGTRAARTQGAGNSALTFTSQLLGLLGNEVEVRVVAGAGLTISVTKEFKASSSAILSTTFYRISINDNGGAATALAIAAALNASALVKRLVLVQYGGTGLGVVAAFAYTALAGGLDNGTGDYAELEQVFENVISLTGYKWISFHIRPDERNRMNVPPQDDEELNADYRQILVNV
jgi:hypothetical protein